MNKKGNNGKINETKIYVAVLAIIFVAAIIISVVRLGDGGEEPVPTPTATPADVTPDAPEQTPDLPQDTPVVPVQTPRPPATPAPTPRPTPTATPAPTPTPPPPSDLGSGSFASNSGVGLDLVVDWAAGAGGEGTANVTFSIKLNSYSLYTNAQVGSLVLTVGSDTYYFDTPAVSYEGSALLTTPFATKSVSVPTGSVNVTAQWYYRGTYSGKYIEAITATGKVDVG